MSDETCPACGGTGLTEHEQHTVETDEEGSQTPLVRRWTGACGTCTGTGQSH
ncbi:hypothetical protein ACSMX9_15680 [Streptomyces sp. LE64]|uniref:hypothetical protein n=1 Tax=unclassified Streptomyces TaxID=2593676 RepID=UPI0033183E7A